MTSVVGPDRLTLGRLPREDIDGRVREEPRRDPVENREEDYDVLAGRTTPCVRDGDGQVERTHHEHGLKADREPELPSRRRAKLSRRHPHTVAALYVGARAARLGGACDAAYFGAWASDMARLDSQLPGARAHPLSRGAPLVSLAFVAVASAACSASHTTGSIDASHPDGGAGAGPDAGAGPWCRDAGADASLCYVGGSDAGPTLCFVWEGDCCDPYHGAPPVPECCGYGPTCPPGRRLGCEQQCSFGPDGGLLEGVDAGPLKACATSADCVVVPSSCCGTCGAATADDMIAVSRDSAANYRTSVCAGTSCPACAPQQDPFLFASCGSGGWCAAFDLQASVATCGTDADCELRPADCCGCSSRFIAVARASESEYLRWACAGDTSGCHSCPPPTPPSGAAAACDTTTHRCAIVGDATGG